jgi:hypothetical protein
MNGESLFEKWKKNNHNERVQNEKGKKYEKTG